MSGVALAKVVVLWLYWRVALALLRPVCLAMVSKLFLLSSKQAIFYLRGSTEILYRPIVFELIERSICRPRARRPNYEQGFFRSYAFQPRRADQAG
jgi:hypothetical protein